MNYKFWKMKKPTPPMPPPNRYGNEYFDDEARERAVKLLWDHLSDQQKIDYVRTQYQFIYVVGGETGDQYQVSAGNTMRMKDRLGFCLHVPKTGYIPYEDMILARKILLEKDEDLFLRTANAAGGVPLRIGITR